MLERLGQLFVIGLKGPELASDEIDFIVKNNIGGVVLFDRNIKSPQQLHRLCSEIQALRLRQSEKQPLLISIDMEGGRVARLKPPFTQWPALRKLGELDSTSLAFKFAHCMAAELRAVGINLDFAPCVDVLTNPQNKVIGDRSISDNPEQVSKIASALVRGYIKNDVIPCAKHFPGHGNTLVDSHEDLPIENATLEELQNGALIPFKKAFRARLDLLMTAHIQFPKIDPEHPVTLSRIFLRKILREEMRYRNLVISDDLDMKAVSKFHGVEETAVKALDAGCDILLYCNIAEHPPRGLEAVKKAVKDKKLSSSDLEASLQRVANLKKEYLVQPEPPPFEEGARMIAHPEHLKIAKAIVEGKIPPDLAAT